MIFYRIYRSRYVENGFTCADTIGHSFLRYQKLIKQHVIDGLFSKEGMLRPTQLKRILSLLSSLNIFHVAIVLFFFFPHLVSFYSYCVVSSSMQVYFTFTFNLDLNDYAFPHL